MFKNAEFNRSTEPEIRTKFDGHAHTVWVQEFKPYLFFWRVPVDRDTARDMRCAGPDRMPGLVMEAKRRWLKEQEYALKFKGYNGQKLSDIELPPTPEKKTWPLDMPLEDQVTWTVEPTSGYFTHTKKDGSVSMADQVKKMTGQSMTVSVKPDIAYNDHWDPGVHANKNMTISGKVNHAKAKAALGMSDDKF